MIEISRWNNTFSLEKINFRGDPVPTSPFLKINSHETNKPLAKRSITFHLNAPPTSDIIFTLIFNVLSSWLAFSWDLTFSLPELHRIWAKKRFVSIADLSLSCFRSPPAGFARYTAPSSNLRTQNWGKLREEKMDVAQGKSYFSLSERIFSFKKRDAANLSFEITG